MPRRTHRKVYNNYKKVSNSNVMLKNGYFKITAEKDCPNKYVHE